MSTGDLDLAAIRVRRDLYVGMHMRPGAFDCCSAHPTADDVPALLAEVEQLRAKLDRWRDELREKRTDLLDVRGILSPNGEAPKTPVSLVPNVASAVRWLLEEVERLRSRVAEQVELEREVEDLRQSLGRMRVERDEAVEQLNERPGGA